MALHEAVAAIPEERRGDRPSPGTWSIAEILEHLALTEARIARFVSRAIAEAREQGLGPETETTSIRPMIDESRYLDRTRRVESDPKSLPTGESGWKAAWAALEQSRDELIAAMADGDGLALAERSAAHPALGELNLYQWIGFVGAHERRHVEQVREVGAMLDKMQRLPPAG